MSETPNHIKDLKPDPSNRRKHNPRNVGIIADAMHAVGAARSVVIDETNTILAGNAAIDAAAQAGITNLQVVDVDGQTIVAVRRRGLSPDQKRHLALADNRSSELAEWDVDQLRADIESGIDLSDFFTEKELDLVIGKDDEVVAAQEIERLDVDEPSDVVWVLLAIPVAEWPAQMGVVEQLQGKAQFSASVVRSKQAKPSQDVKRKQPTSWVE